MAIRVLSVVVLVVLSCAPGGFAQTPGTVKWHFGLAEPSSPALADDGTVYVGTRAGRLHALNPDGTEQWNRTIDSSGQVYTPVVSSDGTIYAWSYGSRILHAINPDGSTRWTKPAGGQLVEAPAIAADGTLYVGYYDGAYALHAFDPDGSEKWVYPLDDSMYAASSIAADGTIYVGTLDGKLQAVYPDGAVKWTFQTGDDINSAPAIGTDGTLYVGSRDTLLYAVAADGTLLWTYATGDAIYASPAIGDDGTIYVGCADNLLYAVNPDGTGKWSFPTGDSISTTPAVGADGTVYLTSNSGLLYALDSAGQLRWSYTVAVWWNHSSPVIGPDGTVYVGGNGPSSSDHMWAFYSDSGSLAESAWPMLRQNPAHTGRRLPVDVPPVPLLPGEPVQALLPAGEVHQYTMDTDAGRNLLIEVEPGAGADALVLDAGLGHVPHPGGGEYSTMDVAQSGNYELLVSPTAGGTYVVTVLGTRVAISGGNYTLTARFLDDYLSDVTPSSGGNVGEVSVSVFGLGFAAGVDVELVSSGTTVLVPDEVTVYSSTDLVARFDLTGAQPDVYDLTVTWPGGAQHTLVSAFTVIPGSGPSLSVELDVPELVRAGRRYVYWLEYGNDGDTDLPAPLFFIASPQGVRMRLSNDEPFSTDGLQVLGISFSQPADVLKAGESYRVPIYFEALLDTTLDFEVEMLDADSTPIDWDGIEGEVRPPDMSAELWDAVWTNFKSAIGTTLDDYESAIGGAADYLSRYGSPTYDATELFGALFQRATGAYLREVHAFGLDALSTARGVPLYFTRVAYSGLHQRFTPGPLGRGWSHAFEYSLTRPASDRVVVRTPGGSARTFFLDKNRWRGLPGEHARLEDVGGGAFTLREKSGVALHFDAAGTLVGVDDPDGNGVTLSYAGSQLEQITHSNGQSIALDYNPDGRIQYLTDHAGRVTEYVYDPEGQLLEQVVAPGGVTTAYGYRPEAGESGDYALVSVTHPDGTHTYYDHDSWGRTSSRWLDGGEELLSTSYDRYGSVFQSDALSHTVSLRLGSHGELLEFENPLHEKLRITYDAGLNPTRMVLPQTNRYEVDSDPRGNPVELMTPLGEVSRAGYEDGITRLAWFLDGRGQLMEYEHDTGRLTRIGYPDTSFEAYTYDADGDLDTFTSRRQDTFSLVHNGLGELTDVDWPDGTFFDFGHDETERTWTFTDVGGTSTIDFDDRGLLDSAEGADGRWIQYTYNDAGRRQRLETHDGFVLDYHWDGAGRLESLTDGSGFDFVRYTYDAAGRLMREDRGNDTATTYDYDAADQLLAVTHYDADDGVHGFFSYTYDSNGNPDTMTTAAGTTVYGYDANGRLESVTDPEGGVVVFEYDAAGNRTTVLDDGAPTDYTVNELNQYTEVGAARLTYDVNGNLETSIDVGGTATLTWDLEDRLQSVETPADGTWTSSYDALGRRVGVAHDGVGRHFVIDTTGLGDVIAEYDDAGDLVARYIHGLGLVARIDAAGNPAYYGFDAIGNTRQVTDASGAVVNAYDYTPFGIPLNVVEGVANPFRFGGRYGAMDDGNAYLHLRARFYEPVTGHFLSPDPVGLVGGANLYTYAVNSPLRYADPSGLRGLEEFYNAGRRRNEAYWQIVTLEAEDMGKAFEEYGQAREEYSRAAPLAAWEVAKDAAKGWATGPFYWKYPNATAAWEWGKLGYDAVTTPPRPEWAGGDPPRDGFPRDASTSGSSTVVFPQDPNEKHGPPGIGPDRIVVAGRRLPYTVYFENLATATAPAQEVFVHDCVDHNLAWTTLRVGEVAFGDHVAANPGQGQVFVDRVDVPDYRAGVDEMWWVDVITELDLATGCLDLTLRMLDPETGELPMDPLAGFLPPEDGSGRGQGHVSFSVASWDDLDDGRLIRNRASIVFDINEAIWTNEVINTIGQFAVDLEVSLAGDGVGTVASDPTGIDCPGTCQAFFPPADVELVATPAPDSIFAGYSGDADCADGIVTSEGSVSCTATFIDATKIFADGFESGDTSSWTSTTP